MWVVDPAARGDGYVHVYPESGAEEDIVHEEPPEHRARAPISECPLCAAGTCVQRLAAAHLVIHARWSDA